MVGAFSPQGKWCHFQTPSVGLFYLDYSFSVSCPPSLSGAALQLEFCAFLCRTSPAAAWVMGCCCCVAGFGLFCPVSLRSGGDGSAGCPPHSCGALTSPGAVREGGRRGGGVLPVFLVYLWACSAADSLRLGKGSATFPLAGVVLVCFTVLGLFRVRVSWVTVCVLLVSELCGWCWWGGLVLGVIGFVLIACFFLLLWLVFDFAFLLVLFCFLVLCVSCWVRFAVVAVVLDSLLRGCVNYSFFVCGLSVVCSRWYLLGGGVVFARVCCAWLLCFSGTSVLYWFGGLLFYWFVILFFCCCLVLFSLLVSALLDWMGLLVSCLGYCLWLFLSVFAFWGSCVGFLRRSTPCFVVVAVRGCLAL